MVNLAALFAGLLFGLGLAVSGMTHPGKVLDFLDVAGRWDASLLFVLGGAVGVTVLVFRLILRRKAPLFADGFHLPHAQAIDRPLLAGAVIFGIGWGISGYCPGPAIALLAAPNWEAWVFLPAMLLGALLHRIWIRGQITRGDLVSRTMNIQGRSNEPS
jgi:uncharacterized membrane protein YedE/YeeE